MRHTSGLFWLVLTLSGCATAPSVHWVREDVHPVAVKGDRLLDHAKIWSGDAVFEWRTVIITRDSISGIPLAEPSGCTSCRTALPTSAVDSLSVGYARNGGDHESPWWTPLLILALVLSP
jgi:hypothetical protein